MKMRFGTVDLEVTQDSPDQVFVKFSAASDVRVTSPPEAVHPKLEQPNKPLKDARDTVARDVRMLVQSGFTKKTLSMIVSKVLGIQVDGKNLAEKFLDAEIAALEFLDRRVPPDIWAIYVAPVEIAGEETVTAAIGLSEKNQLVILALEPLAPAPFFEKLKVRGLTTEQLKIGILSFHSAAIKEFRQAFPTSSLALDWQEFIDLSVGTDTKEFLRDAMKFEDPEAILGALDAAKAPKELGTFMEFKKDLWRVLKTTSPVKRMAKDLRGKLRSRVIQTKEHRELVKVFSLIRLQYHWLKIPVDAPQLRNLKYMQEESRHHNQAASF